jgi:hypothetical protein
MSTDVSITDLIAEANARFTKTPECYSDQHIEVRLTRALQAVTVPTEAMSDERDERIMSERITRYRGAACDALGEEGWEINSEDELDEALLTLAGQASRKVEAELGALLARWDDTERPDGWNSGDEHHLADLLITALRSASQPVQVEVTDEIVEKAALALWKDFDSQYQGGSPEQFHGLALLALEAALGGGDQ